MWQRNLHHCLWVLIIASVTSCWRRSLRHVYVRCTFYRLVCVALLCAVSSPCNSHLCLWVLIMASVTSCRRRVLRYIHVKCLFDGYVCCIYMRFRNFVRITVFKCTRVGNYILLVLRRHFRDAVYEYTVMYPCWSPFGPVWQPSYIVMQMYTGQCWQLHCALHHPRIPANLIG